MTFKKRHAPPTSIRSFAATHTWRGNSGKLARCKCSKQTTGEVTNVHTRRSEAMCSDCAVKKGFVR